MDKTDSVSLIIEQNDTDPTLRYYEDHAEEFTANTIDADMKDIRSRFLSHLPAGARILDFGCGSGRDSKYFLSKGYEVEACDGSREMVRIASQTAGIPVRRMLFEELDEVKRYDGIFACASLLHVPYAQLPAILAKIERALKDDGTVYASFKYGTFEGERGGRYFTDMTGERFGECLAAAGGRLKVVQSRITGDVRPGRGSEKWLNVILRKAPE